MTDEYINTELAHLKRLRKELPLMRNENKRLTGYIQDTRAYLRHALREGVRDSVILSTLAHDIRGLANDEPCFLPRVTGYAQREKKKI